MVRARREQRYVLGEVDPAFAADVAARRDAASASTSFASVSPGGGAEKAPPMRAPPLAKTTVAPSELVVMPVGVFGYSRTCLYWSVVALTVVALLNLGLLLYVCRALGGSGASLLDTAVRVDGGVFTTDGDAYFPHGLQVASLKGGGGGPLVIDGDAGTVLRGGDAASVAVGPESAVVQAQRLTVDAAAGERLLDISAEQCTVSERQWRRCARRGWLTPGRSDRARRRLQRRTASTFWMGRCASVGSRTCTARAKDWSWRPPHRVRRGKGCGAGGALTAPPQQLSCVQAATPRSRAPAAASLWRRALRSSSARSASWSRALPTAAPSASAAAVANSTQQARQKRAPPPAAGSARDR